MSFYLIIIAITTLLFYLANRYYNQKILFVMFFGLFVLLPSVVGGCRDTTIGSDLQASYGVAFFKWVGNIHSLTEFLVRTKDMERGYLLLNLLCRIVSKDIHFFLFVSELIKILLVGLTAIHFRKDMNPNLLIIAYLLTFYWYSFSMMRQGLALCIVLYSLTFYFDKKYTKFVIAIVIAYLFHNSAVFIACACLAHFLYRKTKNPSYILMIGVVVVYVFAVNLFLFIAQSGLFREELEERYLDSGVTSSKTDILIAIFYLFIPFIIKQKNSAIDFWKYMVRANAMICLMFLFLSSYFEVAFRVAMYSKIVLFIAFPILLTQMRKSMIRQTITSVYIMLFVLHIYIAANHGMAGTIPYTSMVLNKFFFE